MMSDATTPPDDDDIDGPWAIKVMPARERKMALAAAKRLKMPMGQYLALAIRTQHDKEHEAPGVAVMPPGRMRQIDGIDPPSIEDFERALDCAERLAQLRGQRLSNGLTEAMVNRLGELIGIEDFAQPFTRRLRGPKPHGPVENLE